MQQVSPHATDVLGVGRDKDAMRLESYWQARAKYLAFGMAVRPDADPRVMLYQLRRPLLDMVAISPDFRPASEPLLALAEAVRETDPLLSDQVKFSLQSALSSPSSRPPISPLVNLN
jgi:spermidine synthase